ncbi:MAG: cysteine desulfurase [Clostridia bacterium]|nr:cysteine desulfurase [Clostridia bacterium]
MRIYLDHASTTALKKEVLDAMTPYFLEHFENANSLYSGGRQTANAVALARQSVANNLGCLPNEIYFTSGGSEADTWALKGIALAHKNKGNKIIISKIEHHAILNTAKWLKKQDFEIVELPVDKNGIVSVEELERLIDDNTILVSVMYVNNEVGTIQPIKELAKVCHDHKVLFHSDCVQAVPYLPLNFKELGLDLASISAHKFNGPKGIGALYVRNGVKIDKLISGGSQERAHRGGTTDTPSIVGMAKALELVQVDREKHNAHVKELRNYFESLVKKSIPYVHFNGGNPRVSSVSNLSFEFVESEGILMLLDMDGIAVSSGSACASGSLDPSHVLLSMGVPIEIAHGSVRFTFGQENTKEEVEYTVQSLTKIIERLRLMSPLFNLKQGETYNV